MADNRGAPQAGARSQLAIDLYNRSRHIAVSYFQLSRSQRTPVFNSFASMHVSAMRCSRLTRRSLHMHRQRHTFRICVFDSTWCCDQAASLRRHRPPSSPPILTNDPHLLWSHLDSYLLNICFNYSPNLALSKASSHTIFLGDIGVRV